MSGRRRPEAWLLVFHYQFHVVTNHWGFGEDHFSELEIWDRIDGLCSKFVDIQRDTTTLLDYRSRCAMYE